MKVKIKWMGYSPIISKHCYSILTDNGHADWLYEPIYVKQSEIEMDDRLWEEGSGWVTIHCDSCDYESRERVYPGMIFKCPICETEEIIPASFVGEDNNMLPMGGNE